MNKHTPFDEASTSSYTSRKLGPVRRVAEISCLLKLHGNLRVRVSEHLANMRANQRVIEEALDKRLRGREILEIGPGQLSKQARYFGAENTVTAVDLDEIAGNGVMRSVWKAVRNNGSIRAAKTAARIVLGVDRRFAAEMARQEPHTAEARIKTLRANASAIPLPDEQFDCAVSVSVFEHLPDPRAVLQEITRLLKPGGVSFHLVHLYTSDSGAHDPRTFDPRSPRMPYWLHLIDSRASSPNCYVNGWRLREWLKAFDEYHPGAQVAFFPNHRPGAKEALSDMRAAGLFTSYTDQELMTDVIQVCWKKPS